MFNKKISKEDVFNMNLFYIKRRKKIQKKFPHSVKTIPLSQNRALIFYLDTQRHFPDYMHIHVLLKTTINLLKINNPAAAVIKVPPWP